MKYQRNATWFLWKFALFKVPLIFWLRPKVLELNDEKAIVVIRLTRRSRNHLKSMYFGALCVGADVTGGIQLVQLLNKQKTKVSFVFKDFSAEFLKRPEADVHFTCNDGVVIKNLIARAMESGLRENCSVTVIATTPTLSGDEPVARFHLTLSIKKH